ncbi:alanine--tRNA ligase [Clostridium sp. D2Q-11]|uniref:Alanine--tRNA ligase n=1 Tax=Anaeromonas frigoriresistens TaxID=2683708 RepID=A0A942UVK4_9FIRM|nr:alanine--tRNA ligase [Anaeromonas frigoriresistens]MBS4540044.1 alanine--tRNA ligase [Anaeromonas frigoriresistens]
MNNYSLHKIREEYLNFFKEKNHLVRESFSLVPKNDKSLLLINAGMAPLKPYFIGTLEPPNKRMSTCQKCVRTGDIENVGKTDRHGTFFEMLGNFSFGDYFKTEAIDWAWEFMTEVLKISKDKLWVSVYLDDDDAYKIWNEKIGVSKDRIVRLGKEDNFWEMEVGPCGPCSEIYIDRGEKYSCGDEDCKPGCECDRYVEVWNLVFSQYDKDEKGNYNPLPNPNIDTGMGLERITAVLNDANNIFEIEPIITIINEVEKTANVKYGEDKKTDVSIRVITDHIRAMTFLVCDGVIPSNEGRGYVLRRVIRRASRHGKLLGIKGNFLNRLVDSVIDNWKEFYNELDDMKGQIKKIIKIEEEKFEETIDQGIEILKSYINEMKSNNETTLKGEKAFKLYDTYGFPLDLTKEILEDEDLKVDEEQFNKEMESQRNRARSARSSDGIEAWDANKSLDLDVGIKTEFEGYDKLSSQSKVLAIIKESQSIEKLSENEEGYIILDNTPFYGESGGQIGDKGTIENKYFTGSVYDTKRNNDRFLHLVKVNSGEIRVGDQVNALVDKSIRSDIARNHSATHLLHKALKEVIGEHVNQAGSLVTEDRLRFDFTHFEALTKEQVNEIEKVVNKQIFDSLQVEVLETSIDEAKQMGATALFDEKYGEKVRLVKIGDYSMELCGGTHINNVSQIGMFKIIGESGIASGVRRIEAVTGRKLYNMINEMENEINSIATILKTNKDNFIEKAKSTINEVKTLEKEIDMLKSKLANSKIDDLLKEVYKVDGINIITKKIDGMDIDGLRQLGDKLKDKTDNIVVVLGTEKDNKVNFIATATQDAVKEGIHCGNIIREVAKTTGGGGGGRPNMAQAGGKDPAKIQEALNKVKELVKEQLNK